MVQSIVKPAAMFEIRNLPDSESGNSLTMKVFKPISL